MLLKGLPQAAFPINRQQLFSLHHQVVRDLAWSLWGHNLFAAEDDQPGAALPIEMTAPDWPWLIQLDQSPQQLLSYLKGKNSRLLGSYFECLWQFYFSHHPLFKQHSFNLQIHDQQRTLGELDVLLETVHGHQYHIELSCKFYLYHEPQALWLGPQGNDRLDIKFEHSYQQQLKMSTTPLARQTIAEHTPWPAETHFHPFAIWRGCLFTAENMEADTRPPRWRGHWYHCQTFINSDFFNQNHWQILDKTLWLSPYLSPQKPPSNQALAPLIAQHFPTKHYALKLARMQYDAEQKLWWECERVMLVADDWPAGHKADSALIPARPCSPPV